MPVVWPRSANSRGTRGDLGPQLGALLGDGTLDGGSLHLALVVHDDTCVVLEVDEHALAAAPSLLLADDDTLQHLLPQLRLALLTRAQHHVARTALRDLVQAATDAAHGDDVQVLRTAVVRAIEQGGDAATQRHLELATAA